MASDDVILMEDVWVRYEQRVVLEGITLTVQDKEIVSIVGPNGGGKTTLLNTILGFKKPFRGKVLVFGKDPTRTQKSGLIGYLPQISGYDRRFPVCVFDVVAMSSYARKGLGKGLDSDDRERILNALERVEMSDFADHHFGSLSSGQQQRVFIARALVGQPKLLILDEPSTGLDAVAQDTFYHLLRTIRDEEDLAIIMVSHDIGSVSSVVDRIACLNKKIHFHGKPQDCIPSEALEKVFGKHIHFLIHDEHCESCEK
jgi:zinc transport system ATP-binding protein